MDTGDSRQAGFNVAKVRSGIKFAMQMGIPGTLSERATFFWNSAKTYTNPDVNSKPWDWTTTPASSVTAVDAPASLSIPVSMEFLNQTGSSGGGTKIGSFDTPRVKLTILDDEYAKITDVNLGLPNGITVDGSTYDIEYWAPPIGLFDLSVYVCFAVARDEA